MVAVPLAHTLQGDENSWLPHAKCSCNLTDGVPLLGQLPDLLGVDVGHRPILPLGRLALACSHLPWLGRRLFELTLQRLQSAQAFVDDWNWLRCLYFVPLVRLLAYLHHVTVVI